jgi:hypothetical protein
METISAAISLRVAVARRSAGIMRKYYKQPFVLSIVN